MALLASPTALALCPALHLPYIALNPDDSTLQYVRESLLPPSCVCKRTVEPSSACLGPQMLRLASES